MLELGSGNYKTLCPSAPARKVTFSNPPKTIPRFIFLSISLETKLLVWFCKFNINWENIEIKKEGIVSEKNVFSTYAIHVTLNDALL